MSVTDEINAFVSTDDSYVAPLKTFILTTPNGKNISLGSNDSVPGVNVAKLEALAKTVATEAVKSFEFSRRAEASQLGSSYAVGTVGWLIDQLQKLDQTSVVKVSNLNQQKTYNSSTLGDITIVSGKYVNPTTEVQASAVIIVPAELT